MRTLQTRLVAYLLPSILVCSLGSSLGFAAISASAAEAPLREERARLLAAVAANGFIDDYSGIRISKSGRRFRKFCFVRLWQ